MLIILLQKRDDAIVSDKTPSNPFTYPCIAVVKTYIIPGFGQLIISEFSVNIQLSINIYMLMEYFLLT